MLRHVLLFLFFPTFLAAQTTWQGQVSAINGSPLEFATVSIFQATDSSFIQGMVTDADGSFSIQPITQKQLMLRIEHLGYLPLDTLIATAILKEQLAHFQLTPNANDLTTVEVTGRRVVFQRELDRLVFHVDQARQLVGGTAVDVLGVTPGVQLNNNQLSMAGKRSMLVFVNNKRVQLTGADLITYLESIAADDIKTISVYTSPPARYAAVGNAGVVDIRLRAAAQDSWQASLRATGQQRTFRSQWTNGFFMLNKKRLQLALFAGAHKGKYRQEQDDYAYFPDGLWYTSSPFTGEYQGANARLDVGYDISPTWSLEGQYSVNARSTVYTDNPYMPVFDYESDAIRQYLQTETHTQIDPTFHSGNISSTIALDTLGRSLSVSADYFTLRYPDAKRYTGTAFYEQPISSTQYYAGQNDNQQQIDNYALQLDANLLLGKEILSVGGRWTNTRALNFINAFNSGLRDEPVTNWFTTHSSYRYREQIGALYASWQKAWGEQWQLQTGCRLEWTNIEQYSDDINTTPNTGAGTGSYLTLFPNLHLQYQASDQLSIGMAYTRLLDRPYFFQLNPNIYFVNPFQSIAGNPFLQPSFGHQVELTVQKGQAHSRFYWSIEDGIFGQVPLAEAATNNIRFVNQNYINTQTIGFTQSISINSASAWRNRNSVDLAYIHSDFILVPIPPGQTGLNLRLSSFNSWTFGQREQWQAELNVWYSPKQLSGIFETKAAGNVAINCQWASANQKLSVSLRANDIFKTQAERLTATVNDVLQTARYYYDTRSLQLTLAWKIGGQTKAFHKKAGSNQTEKSRLGY